MAALHIQLFQSLSVRANDGPPLDMGSPTARTYLAMRRLYDRAGQTAWAVDCHFRATTIFDELSMADERRAAQGRAAGDRTGAIVISGLELSGPNVPAEA